MKYSVKDHYQNLANQYDEFWEYSPNFIDFLTHQMIKSLNLVPTDKLVDLGCGTGLYTKSIVAKVSLKYPVICVDSSPKMLEQIPKTNQYRIVVQDAIEFASGEGIYDKILMKEMIHHIPDKETLLQRLFKCLKTGGILLLILLPPTLEYPLFADALRIYESVQPNYNDLINILLKIGFQITVKFVNYPVSIPKERYLKMVQNRYMSLLSRFDDEQLSQGLREIQQKYANKENLVFSDRFIFIGAHKPN